jgi:enoyl-CoA hydratase
VPEAESAGPDAGAPLVTTAVLDGIAIVTLDDPAHRNSLSAGMTMALVDAFDELDEEPDVRAAVVTATPPVFCAGGHLTDLVATNRRPLLETYAGFVRIAESRLPTVAAVNGPAVGAGINVALACDVVVASPSARFDCRWLDVGIHPGGGFCWRLERAVGYRRAVALTLLGESLSAREAVDAGLAWRCVSDLELPGEARRLAAKLASRPPELLRRTRDTLRASAFFTDEDDAIERERAQQDWSMAQPEFAATVASVMERIAAKEAR